MPRLEDELQALRQQAQAYQSQYKALQTKVDALQTRLLTFKAAYDAAIMPIEERLQMVNAAIDKLNAAPEPIENIDDHDFFHVPPSYDDLPDIEISEPAVNPTDPTIEARRLYRDLARRFHPDLAHDAADAKQRHDLMTQVNAAYAANDLDFLRRLGRDDAYYQAQQALLVALQRTNERCRKRIFMLKQNLHALQACELHKLCQEHHRARLEGRDLLTELAINIEQQYQAALGRLYALRRAAANQQHE